VAVEASIWPKAYSSLPGQASRLSVVVADTVLLEEPVPDARVGVKFHLAPGGTQCLLRPSHFIYRLPLVNLGVVAQVSRPRPGVVNLPCAVEGDDCPHKIGLTHREQQRPSCPG
jgi:hypothetical protein